jgi:ERCC4-type nuclease
MSAPASSAPAPVSIAVDMRERDLLALLADDPRVASQPLDVGDVIVTAPGVCLVFERKTLADWAASRKDSRYSEQKQRLLAATPSRHHITYIIEGATATTCRGHGLSSSIFLSMAIHTMYRDGLHVTYTADAADTARWILAIADRVAKNPAYFTAPDAPADAESSAADPDAPSPSGGGGRAYLDSVRVKTRRSDNTTPRSVYLLQISQLPSMSLKTAAAIAEAYPSWIQLTRAVTETPKALRDIPGIGPKRAETLVKFIKAGAAEADAEADAEAA